MKRRIALLAGTFLTLLVAYLVYHFSAGGLERWISGPPAARRDPLRLPPPPPPMSGGGLGVDPAGDGLRVENRDPKTGRLEGVFYFPHWEKQDDGSYAVEEPNVTLYHRTGERTYVYARRGRVEVEQLTRQRWEVRRGDLSGNVTIWYDRNPSAGPLSAGHERLRQVVRIYADDIHLDNERLFMETDSRVVVFSDKADLYGNGLEIRWRDLPQELLRLRVRRGGQMFVYEVPEEFGASLPGAGGLGAGGGAAAPAPAPVEPARPRAAASGATASSPAAAGGRRAASAVSSGPAPSSSSGPGTVPSTGLARTPPPPRRNVYRAEFTQRVRVDFPVAGADPNLPEHGYVEGADRLSLLFEWDANSLSRFSGRSQEERNTRREQMSPPASGPAATTASAPASGPAGRESAQPARKRPAPGEPMVITWGGPLVLEPVGYTENASSRRYEISAEGERLLLGDSRTLAACRRFKYASPQRVGELEGESGDPARLILADGMESVCPRIQYRGDSNVAYFLGAGYMVQHASTPLEELQALARETPPPKPNAGLDFISWRDSVQAAFAPDEGSPAGARPSLREANFVGQVVLFQADGNDFVRCGALHAFLDRDANGRLFIARAVASGGVQARQEERQIAAGKVIMGFRPWPFDPNRATRGPRAPQFARPQPVSLEAEGNVVVVDDLRPERVVAQADWLQSDLVRMTAVLRGSPAAVTKGTDRMEGPEIRLTGETDANLADPSASVRGAGRLFFLVRKDLNGADLQVPRPLRIAWTESMNYTGLSNQAVFRGGVRLESNAASPLEAGQDGLTCRRSMRVLFEKAPAAGAGAASQGSGGAMGRRAGRSALTLADYSLRKVAAIVADEDVEMFSSRLDPGGRLLRRLTVTGPQLLYDPNQTQIFGRGRMLVEDYRPPAPRAQTTSSTRDAEDLQRPQQTTFYWDTLMSLWQKDRTAILEGNVVMDHRSGIYVKAEGLLFPPWPELKTGRFTTLWCQRLSGTFAEPEANSSAVAGRGAPTRSAGFEGPRLEGGPRLGEPVLIYALGDVTLEDGLRKKRAAIGQQLEYRKRDPTTGAIIERVTILGSLEGQPRKNAVLKIKDLDTGKQEPDVTGSSIVWFLNSDRVEAHDVSAGGGR